MIRDRTHPPPGAPWHHTLKKLVVTPAFFVCVLAWAATLQAQPVPASTAPGAAFDVVVQAPAGVQDYLQRHLELQRYRELGDIDALELERLMAAAQRNAQDLLGTLGYFAPDVAVTLRPGTAQAGRAVVITVVPGELTRVVNVTIAFSGPVATDAASQAQREAIRQRWPLRPGLPFTQAAWDNAKSQALQQLTSQRYPLGQLLASQADIDPSSTSAQLSVELASGPGYQLGPLQVSGLQRHDLQMVRRLARLTPGDDYDQTRLLEAQQRLSDSGYFDSVFVSLDTSGDATAAPVNVQLREARLQKLVLGVGVSTDGGGRLSAEHTHHRVPGLGWRAVSKLQLDRETRLLATELTAPPDDNNWRWSTGLQIQQQSAASLDVSSQRLRAGRSQSGERIDRNYYLQYDRARTVEGSTTANADALTANGAWTWRYFDSLPFPTSGYGLGAELGGGSTLGSGRQPFLRAQAKWLGLWSPGKDAASPAESASAARASRYSARAEVGVVLARPEAQLPSTQLFLTGGDTTVRGYGFKDIGTVQADGSVVPGRYMASGGVEWQHPIVVNGRLTSWEGTLFVDAGAVADQPRALKAKVGLGAGLLWKSPVGPLQIDLAYGVAVKQLRLHLRVGFTF